MEASVGLNLPVWAPNPLECRQIRGEAAVWVLGGVLLHLISLPHLPAVALIPDAADKRRLKGPAEHVGDRSLLACKR